MAIFLVALDSAHHLLLYEKEGKEWWKDTLPSSEDQKPVVVYTDREAESRPVVMLEMKENIAYSHVEHQSA